VNLPVRDSREVTDSIETGAEIASWDELVSEHANDTDPYWREQIALALASKGWKLANERGRPAEAIFAWDELARRYADGTEPELGRIGRDALVEEGLLLMELKRSREAPRVYRRASAQRIRRRGARAQELLALALFGWVWLGVTFKLVGPATRLRPALERLRGPADVE
jgi:hypothetical protein